LGAQKRGKRETAPNMQSAQFFSHKNNVIFYEKNGVLFENGKFWSRYI
jgi:hypothetical protein